MIDDTPMKKKKRRINKRKIVNEDMPMARDINDNSLDDQQKLILIDKGEDEEPGVPDL